MPCARPASMALSAGIKASANPRSLADSIIGKTPRTGRREPSRENYRHEYLVLRIEIRLAASQKIGQGHAEVECRPLLSHISRGERYHQLLILVLRGLVARYSLEPMIRGLWPHRPPCRPSRRWRMNAGRSTCRPQSIRYGHRVPVLGRRRFLREPCPSSIRVGCQEKVKKLSNFCQISYIEHKDLEVFPRGRTSVNKTFRLFLQRLFHVAERDVRATGFASNLSRSIGAPETSQMPYLGILPSASLTSFSWLY